jgi:hypothetical protein
MDVERVVTKEELQQVREMRAEFKARMKEVNDRDFNDPGDKQSTNREHHARNNQSHNGDRTIHGTDHSGQKE